MSLENFFNPKSVAVIGASNDKNKVGYALMKNLLDGAKREIYPITLSEKEILGIPASASVLNISEKIDLAIIAVRADIVPQVLADCGKKQISNAIIISAGFKEIDSVGKELEDQIKNIAKEQGMTILGPNCLGVVSTRENFNSTFATGSPPAGSIAFLSQSGALGAAVLDMAVSDNVGFSKFISLGNEAQLTEIEFLKFLADDEHTKSIFIYLEKLSNGPEFIELAGKISKTKPIVVLKAGRSSHGARAVSSHTGSLAPDEAVFSAACKQAGIITVNSIRGFFNMAKLFQMGTTKPLQKITILTNGGGPSVIATDLVDLSCSLSLAQISEQAKEKLKKVLPSMASVQNPVDIIGDALSDRFEKALEILVKEKETDAILLLVTPQMMTEARKTAELVKKYSPQKPIIPVFLGGPHITPAKEFLKENGMVNFDFPIDAISVLASLSGGLPKITHPDPSLTTREGQGEQLTQMSFKDASKILNDYDLSISGKFVKDKDELYNVVNEYDGDALAMKIISSDIIHKTDSGAVALNIKNVEEAKKAWDEMRAKNQKANTEGVLIQRMEKPARPNGHSGGGREVIIGMKRDTTFGPTILFGLGGILAEAIKDTALRIAPVEKEGALKMMKEIKGAKILQGMRGEKPINFDLLTDIIVNLSKLSLEHPEIKEIDLNPIICSENSATIVDARIMI